MRIFHSSLLFASLCFVVDVSAQEAFAPDAQSDKVVVDQVADFLKHFIDPQKTVQQQAALFTEDAHYYAHGRVSNAAIVKDIEYFVRRWPDRAYRLTSIHYVTPDPVSGKVFVSYEIAYRVAGKAGTASGKAKYGAVIANLGTAPKIEWIKERVGK